MACDYSVWMKVVIYAHLAEKPCKFPQLHFPRRYWKSGVKVTTEFRCGNAHYVPRLIFNIPDMRNMPTYLPLESKQNNRNLSSSGCWHTNEMVDIWTKMNRCTDPHKYWMSIKHYHFLLTQFHPFTMLSVWKISFHSLSCRDYAN